MPNTVDTKPSMPLAPRFASTRRPSRGAMHHSSARTGRLDATTSAAPSGSACATSRAMTTFERRVGIVEHAVDRGPRPRLRSLPPRSPRRGRRVRRSERVGDGAEQRLGIGDDPLARPRGAGRATHRRDRRRPARIGPSSHAFAILLVERRADAHHEIGSVRAGERRRRAAAPRTSRSRRGPSAGREIGSASTGQPAAVGEPRRRSRPRTSAPQPATTTPRSGARARVAASRRRPAAGVGARAATRRRVHGAPSGRPGASTSGAPVGTKRFPERKVEMHRAGGRSDRMSRDRAARERAPRRVRVGDVGRRTGIAEPAHRVAVQLRLVDRLPGAGVAQLGRTVGGAHDQRDARVRGLDDRGMEVRGRRPRRAAQDRGPPACERRSRAPGTQPSARRARPARGSGRRARERARAASNGIRARRPRRVHPDRAHSSTSAAANAVVRVAFRHRVDNAARMVAVTDRVRARLHADRVGLDVACSTSYDEAVRGDRRRRADRARSFEATAAAIGEPAARAIYVGYSMGGRLCLRLALDRPDLVRALVLVSASPGLRRPPKERGTRSRADEALARRRSNATASTRSSQRWLAQPMFASVPARRAGLADRRRSRPEYLAALPARARHRDAWSRCGTDSPSCRCRSLLVTGTRRRRSSTRIAAEMLERDRTRTPTHVRLDGGHALPLEQPGRSLGGLRRRVRRAATARRTTSPTARSAASTSWKRDVPISAAHERRRVGAVAHQPHRTDRERARRAARASAGGSSTPHTTTATSAPTDARRRTACGRVRAPNAHRERALARDRVGLDVADVVGEQDRRTPAGRPPARRTTQSRASVSCCTYALPSVATNPKNTSTITSPSPM